MWYYNKILMQLLAWRWSKVEMSYLLSDYRKTWIELRRKKQSRCFFFDEDIFTRNGSWIEQLNKSEETTAPDDRNISHYWKHQYGLFRHSISYLTSWIANKIASLFLFFFHSKRDVQWCYLLVDCQIGWSCFSHFFSFSPSSSSSSFFPTRPQPTSGRLFDDDDSASNKKTHARAREREKRKHDYVLSGVHLR